jgi:chaperonin GroES
MSREIKPENLKPVSDRVVIRPDKKADKTESNILMPTGAVQANHIMTGEVVAVGNGKPGIEMTVKKGDAVMFPEHTGTEIVGGLLIMNEPQILSVI